MVLEYCSKGDLLSYLKSHREAILKNCHTDLLSLTIKLEMNNSDEEINKISKEMKNYLCQKTNDGVSSETQEMSDIAARVDQLLDEFESTNKPGDQIGLGQLFQWCREVANGMRFIR